MAKSTTITTNYNALLRAAENIMSKRDNLSKNAVMNCLARAITGAGKDAGFLKNAPNGIYIQPGLEAPRELTSQPSLWMLEIDHKDGWSNRTRLFPSKEAALAAFEDCRAFYVSDKFVDFDEALRALAERGEYDSSPDDTMLEDADADHDEYFDRLDSAVRFEISQVSVEGSEDHNTAERSGDDQRADLSGKATRSTLLYHPHVDTGKYDNMPFGALFRDMDHAESYGHAKGLNDDPDANWRDELVLARDCLITAEFRAEVWRNDYAYEVDPKGDTEWEVFADEIELDQADLDYLKTSRNAPDWVRDWSGPFEVYLSVEEPSKSRS